MAMFVSSVSFTAYILLLSTVFLTGCGGRQLDTEKPEQPDVINAGFVCLEKVYNSELMAPYDIFQHTVYRDSTDYIRCFIVTPDGRPFTTSDLNKVPHEIVDPAPRDIIDAAILIHGGERYESSFIEFGELGSLFRVAAISVE
jgi:hypothetical protein